MRARSPARCPSCHPSQRLYYPINSYTHLPRKLRTQAFVHDFRVCLTFRRLDHLPDEEPKQRFLPTTITRELIRIRRNHLIDQRIDLTSVAHLDQSLLVDDCERALAAAEHLDQNVFRLLSADLSFVDQTDKRAQLFSRNRRLSRCLAGRFEFAQQLRTDPISSCAWIARRV